DQKVINVKVRPKAEGGRLNDAIELVGFLDWLRQVRTKPEPDNLAGSEPQAEPDKNAEPLLPAHRWWRLRKSMLLRCAAGNSSTSSIRHVGSRKNVGSTSPRLGSAMTPGQP